MTNSTGSDAWRSFSNELDIAESLVPALGALYRKKGLLIRVGGYSIVHKDPVELIQLHRTASQTMDYKISVQETQPVIEALSNLSLAPARIDVGLLAKKHKAEGGDLGQFIQAQLADLMGRASEHDAQKPQDVVLYGFGRIGRLLARILVKRTGSGNLFRLRAIVVRPGGEGDLAKRAALLKHDSVHGTFSGTVDIDEANNAIIANGNMIRLLYSNAPDEVDYTAHGISDAIVIDNTGKWRDEAGLSLHTQAKGASRVILTAPAKGDIPNVVYGVNDAEVGLADHAILSAASCTTNAVVPVLQAMLDGFGIESGHLETIHAYTNDQNLIDNFHKKPRRGRAAALNMVITETGAAKAAVKVIPQLKGKLTASAVRVPTPNVSLAIMNLNLGKTTTVEEVTNHLRQASLEGRLQHQIDFVTSPETVSSDLVGNAHASIVDGYATVVDGSRVVLYVWYDNEYGYSRQVIRILERAAGIRLPSYPAER